MVIFRVLQKLLNPHPHADAHSQKDVISTITVSLDELFILIYNLYLKNYSPRRATFSYLCAFLLVLLIVL
jgi:hypothetical protein